METYHGISASRSLQPRGGRARRANQERWMEIKILFHHSADRIISEKTHGLRQVILYILLNDRTSRAPAQARKELTIMRR
jgi:hypothetical protein